MPGIEPASFDVDNPNSRLIAKRLIELEVKGVKANCRAGEACGARICAAAAGNEGEMTAFCVADACPEILDFRARQQLQIDRTAGFLTRLLRRS